jgi:hypothetical protein
MVEKPSENMIKYVIPENLANQKDRTLFNPIVGSKSGAVFTLTRFQSPPPQTVREVFPHTAFRQPSSWGIQGLDPHNPLW